MARRGNDDGDGWVAELLKRALAEAETDIQTVFDRYRARGGVVGRTAFYSYFAGHSEPTTGQWDVIAATFNPMLIEAGSALRLPRLRFDNPPYEVAPTGYGPGVIALATRLRKAAA